MPFPTAIRPILRQTTTALLAVALSASAVLPTIAQDATPTIPGPDLCRVAPLESPVWNGVEVAEPTAPVSIAGPFVPPTGTPAEDATIAAVTETVTQAIACQNAGEVGSLLALYSEDGLRAIFSGPRGQPASEVDALVGADPTPVVEDRLVSLVSVEDVAILADGRAIAIVTTGASGLTYVDAVFLAPNTSGDDRPAWLLDDSVAIDSQTQVEGGATPIP